MRLFLLAALLLGCGAENVVVVGTLGAPANQNFIRGLRSAFSQNCGPPLCAVQLTLIDDGGAVGSNNFSSLFQNVSFSIVIAVIPAPMIAVRVPELALHLSNVRVPLISPGVGLRGFFDPFNKYIINVEPSLDDELEEVVARLLKIIYTKISIVIEPSDIGSAANSSLVLALRKQRLQPFSVAVFDPLAPTNASRFNNVPIMNTSTSAASFLLGDSPWDYPEAVILCFSSSEVLAEMASSISTFFPSWTSTQLFVVSCRTDLDAVAGSPRLTSDVKSKMYFAQSLPPLSAVRTFNSDFFSALTMSFPNAPSPSVASEKGYAVAAFLSLALRRISGLSPSSNTSTAGDRLVQSIFETSVFPLGDVRLGPYGLSCTASETPWEGCGCNSGARAIHFLQLSSQQQTPAALSFIFAASDFTRTMERCVTTQTISTNSLPVIVGQSIPMFSTFSAMGLGLHEGLATAFRMHNDEVDRVGGGKKVYLIVHNDFYTASMQVANVHRMLSREKVDAMALNLGSAANLAVAPILKSLQTNPTQIPLMGAVTGLESLRIDQPLFFNFRASYLDEATAFLIWLRKRRINRIALIYVNSAFGLSGRFGVHSALTYLRMSPLVAEIAHDAANLDANLVFSQLMNQTGNRPPEAIIFFVIQNIAPPFFQLCMDNNFPDSVYYLSPTSLISPGVPMRIRPQIVFSSVMPDLTDLSIPYVRSFFNARAAMPPELTASSNLLEPFEGYLIGRLILDAITWSSGDTSKLVETIFKVHTFSVDGLPIGPFSRPCAPGKYDVGGEECGCSSGLRSVWYARYDPNYNFTIVNNFDTNFTMDSCGMLAIARKPACLPGQQTVYTSTSTMDYTCALCPKGTSNNVTGSELCVTCPIGYISADSGSLMCRPCEPGSYQDRSGQSICFPCPSNTYQDTAGAHTCKPCPDGTVRPEFGGVSASQCVARECIPGEEKVGSVCVACQPGTYFDFLTLTCISCPVGNFSSSLKSTSCKPCPIGTKAPLKGMTQCFACTLSEYQNRTGASQCATCPTNSITCSWSSSSLHLNVTGSATRDNSSSAGPPALTCSTGAVSQSACFCNPSYFLDSSPNHGSSVCSECPEGAHCCMCPEVAACGVDESDAARLGIGTCDLPTLLSNLESLDSPCARCDTGSLKPITKRGFYNVSFLLDNPSTFHTLVPCEPEEACRGGPSNTCSVGYDGLRCGLCSREYYQAADGKCLACPATTSLKLLVTIGVALTPIVVGSFFLYNAESFFRASSMTIAIDWLQTLSILSTFQVPWPEAMRILYAGASLINFKIGILPLSCIFQREWDFYSGWALQFSLPFIICSYCVLLWLLIRALNKLNVVQSRRFSKKSTLINTVCICLTISYTSVTKNAFSFIRCYNFGTISFLSDTPSVQCFSTKWYSFLPLCIIYAIVYCGGVPACAFAVLHRVGTKRSQPKYKRAFGSLYSIFTNSAWYWNVVLLLRKLLVILALSLFPNSPMVQMVLTLCIFSCYVLANNKYSPFAFGPSNRLVFWCNVQATIATLAGILFVYDKVEPTLNSSQISAISAIVWISFIWSLLLCGQGIASEMIGYRLYYRADRTPWIKKLFESRFGRHFLYTRSQHWAIGQEMRERFQTLEPHDRLAVFSHDPSPLKEVLGDDTLHKLSTPRLVEMALRDELGAHAFAYLKAHPEQRQETEKVLRSLLEFKRDSTINQIYSARSDRQAIREGRPPSPFSRTDSFRLRKASWRHSKSMKSADETEEAETEIEMIVTLGRVLNAPSAVIDIPVFDPFEGSGVLGDWSLGTSEIEEGGLEGEQEEDVC